MQGAPRPGEIYKHFKNKYYQIIAIAHHSETDEMLVVYQALYGDFSVCARPYDMFISEVDHEKYPEVEQKYRFELVPEGGLAGNANFYKVGSMENDKTGSRYSDGTESFDVDMLGKLSSDKPEEASLQKENLQDEEIPQGYEKILAFLDADSYKQKREILISMKRELTDEMINTLAASMDVVVNEGDLETRYRSLLHCIDTNIRFETNRFR